MAKARRWWIALALVAACHKPATAAEEEWVDLSDAEDVAALNGTDAVTEVTLADDGTAEDATLPVDAAVGRGPGGKPLNVLFLGNSYTYVNDLPAMTVLFAQSGGVKIQQTSVTQGGATLAVLIAQTEAVATIAKGGWTYVVLQGQSVEPAGDPVNFLAAAKTLAKDVKQVSAQLAFYQTWPRKAGDALYQQAWSGGSPTALAKLLHDGYEKAATQNGGVRVPVGDAWMLTLHKHPEINLYQADGSHPLPTGTYLAACVFSATLFGVDPTVVKWVPDGVTAAEATALRAMCREATHPL